jgi:D-alanine-D-alanine ligase
MPATKSTKTNQVILLFGGTSDERLVSVASAQNLASRFGAVELWFIAETGQISRANTTEVLAHQRPFEMPFQPSEKPFAASIEASLAQVANRPVFIGLHGTEGEDGSLQSLFEKNKIAFSGSDSASSRACFDKAIAKSRVSQAHLKVPGGFSFSRNEKSLGEKLLSALKDFGRIVVKPLASGSSFGLKFIATPEECREFALFAPASVYETYLAEQFVTGRELTIGVLERPDGALQALPPSEVLLQNGHNFDYKGKYLGLGSKEVTPADLTEKERQVCQQVALTAHQTLGCAGYSRTDMILTANGPMFLETNTLPGLTKASFFPQQLEVAQLSFELFLKEQIEIALRRTT